MLDYTDPTGIYVPMTTELWRGRTPVVYGRGMGAAQQSVSEVEKAKAVAQIAPVQQQVASAASALQQLAGQFPTVDFTQVQAQVSSVQSAFQQVAAAIQSATATPFNPNVPPQVGQQLTAQQTAEAQQIQGLEAQLAQVAAGAQALLPAISAARAQAQAQANAQAQAQAQAQANAQAAAQRDQDQQTINGALQQAQVFAGQGNYGGALAVLQSQSVTAAATRTGRAGDVATVLSQITYAQTQGQKQADAAAQAQAASAAQQQAQRDALAAASARVDSAIQRAQALEAAGNFSGALLVLSGATGDAAASNRQSDLQVVQAQVQGDMQAAAAQKQADAAAAAQAQAQAAADARAAQEQARIDAQAARDQAAADAARGLQAQTACIQQGGAWDGQACDLSDVRAVRAAERQQQQVMSLAPFLASIPGGANLLAQAFANMLGLQAPQPQEQAPSVATQAPGMPAAQVSRSTSPYGEGFGTPTESF